MSTWSLSLCHQWSRIGECTAFRFRGVHRELELGRWSLDTSPAGVTFSSYIDPVTGRYTEWGPRDVDSVRLLEDGRVRYSGIVAANGDTGGLKIGVDRDGERWQFSGFDEWYALRSRLAYPDPAVAEPGSWGVARHVETGRASTVITTYINENLGAAALAARELPGFGIIDEEAGLSSSWSARLETVDELVARIARDAGLGVWLDISAGGSLAVRVGAPRDLSPYVRLSDQGDLSRVEASFLPAAATFTLSAGTGTGTSRVFRTASTSATGWERREQLSDVSSLSEAAEVQLDATTRNKLAAAQYRIFAEVANVDAIGYPDRVRLGDRVAVIIKGETYVVPVTAAEFDISPDRQTVRPVLGMAVRDEFTALVRKLDRLAGHTVTSVA